MILKRVLSVCLAVLMSFGICSTAFAYDNYVAVYTAEDFNNIRNNLSGEYILMNDIDLSSYKNWEQIGSEKTPFTGKINGNGYKVFNLNAEVGVFGWLSNAVVENLGVCACLTDRYVFPVNAGILADTAIKTIFENCYTSGTVAATTGNGMLSLEYDFYVGGIVGYSELSSFENCYSIADISLEYKSMNPYAAGGIVGQSKNCEYTCCYAVANFEESFIGYGNTEGKNLYKGGLVGNTVSGDIFNNCYFSDNSEFAVGLPQENPQSTKALTDDEMKSQSSYEGFDFESTWIMEDNRYATLNFEKIIGEDADTPSVCLTEAEIIKVPFYKRIVFGHSPKSPEGITVELKYSDGTTVTEKIISTENGYFVNGESVEINDAIMVGLYGKATEVYFMSEGQIKISYNYLLLPSIPIIEWIINWIKTIF